MPPVSGILQFFTGTGAAGPGTASPRTMTSWTAIFDDDEELGELLDLALGDNDAIAAASAAHKRRMAAAAAAIFPQEGGQGPGGKKEKVKEFSLGEHVRRLTETQFQRRYRLNWRSFYKLLKIIDADLTVTDMKQAKRATSAGSSPTRRSSRWPCATSRGATPRTSSSFTTSPTRTCSKGHRRRRLSPRRTFSSRARQRKKTGLLLSLARAHESNITLKNPLGFWRYGG